MSASFDRPTAGSGSSLQQAAYRAGRVLGRGEQIARRVPVPPPWLVLGGLVVASWGIAAECGRIAAHNGWVYYHGGDGTWYYTTAWVLGNGHVPIAAIGYGYPLLIAPLARIAGPNLLDGMPSIVVFNQLVLAPVALLCIYGITRMYASRGFAYLVTLIWVLFPVAVIHYFLADYHTRYVDITLPSAVGLLGLGDYPSMVLLLVSAYFVLRLAATRADRDAIAAGLAAGLAVSIKPANLLFVPAALVALAVARRPRGIAVVAAGMVPSLIGLALWKYRGLGYLPAFSHPQSAAPATVAPVLIAGLDLHRYLNLDWQHLHHNLDGIREFTWSQRMVYWAGFGGFVGLARRSLVAAALAATWLVVYLVVKGSSPVVDMVGGGFFTHLIAAFPGYFLLVASVPFLIPIYGRRLRGNPSPVGPSPTRLPTVAVWLLGVISAVGVLAVGLLPTLDAPSAVDLPNANLYVPADGFRLSATAGTGAVTLAWPRLQPGGTQVTYAIFRDRSDQAICLPVRHAASNCAFTGHQVAAVGGDTTTWTDHPPAGTWAYRVMLSATSLGPQTSTDYTLLSRPVTVALSG